MSTQLATNTPMPAHLQDVFGDLEANIRSGVSVPTLGFKNKVWSVRDGDAVKPIMLQSSVGPLPSPFVDVVIVGKNPTYSRIFYTDKYASDSNLPPTCSSIDSITPDKGVLAPQALTCAVCPQNVRGSKLAQDKVTPIKACGTVQRLAVVPADDLASKPLLLSFRGNSLFDPDNGDNEKENRYCYGGYEKSLMRDGVNNTAKVVTRIGFDTRPHIEGVKLLFSRRDGWITAEQAPLVVAHVKAPATAQLVTGRLNGAPPALAAPTVALAPPVAASAVPQPAGPVTPPVPVVSVEVQNALAAMTDTQAPVEIVAPAKAQKKVVLKPVPTPTEASPASAEEAITSRIRAQVLAEMAAEAAAKQSVADVTKQEVIAPVAANPVGSLDDILGTWDKMMNE